MVEALERIGLIETRIMGIVAMIVITETVEMAIIIFEIAPGIDLTKKAIAMARMDPAITQLVIMDPIVMEMVISGRVIGISVLRIQILTAVDQESIVTLCGSSNSNNNNRTPLFHQVLEGITMPRWEISIWVILLLRLL